METPKQQVKKRIIKKKGTESIQQPENNEQVETQETSVDESTSSEDPVSFIPSSRIKNYISKEKLNKAVDEIIQKLKTSDANVDLNTLLSEDLQSKLGSVIKQKEEKGEEININSLAMDLLSKQKYKFSNTSFKVLSVFLDMLIEEITLNVMDEIVKNKKSIINLKYVFTNNVSSPLYKVYSTLPTYIAEQAALNKSSEETVDEHVDEPSDEPLEESSDEVSTHSINFEFYIRKICNKLKKNKEEYSKIKVSNNYQKFCSNLILEFLDRVAPMTTIILEVMTTKTITNLVFSTIIKLQLYDNPHCEQLMTELHNRLN